MYSLTIHNNSGFCFLHTQSLSYVKLLDLIAQNSDFKARIYDNENNVIFTHIGKGITPNV